MIEKMKFLRITGPKEDINRVITQYLSKYELHVENALSELSDIHNLTPYVDTNTYRESVLKAEDTMKQLRPEIKPSGREITYKEAEDLLDKMHLMLDDLEVQKKEIKEKLEDIAERQAEIKPYLSFDLELSKVNSFQFIRCQFGRIAIDYYEKLTKYIYEDMNTIFVECKSDKNYVYGAYFVPTIHATKVDAILSSLHFEDMDFPEGYSDTLNDINQGLKQERRALLKQQDELLLTMKDVLKKHAADFVAAYEKLKEYCDNQQIRKLAACTRQKEEVYYILCGWMSEKDTEQFLREIGGDHEVTCFVDDHASSTTSKPPTKLKNPRIFKPFETFIKMYGLPAYKEVDPTIFVALSYSIMFGMMFGDVGQGLCLVIGGYILYKVKKLNLAAILSCAGIFSTIFGFLYGSVFGFEEWLEPIWTNPMKNPMTVLITAVGFGVFLIIIAMILNIVNGIREKNIEKIFFDTNGIAGLVFYASVVGIVVLLFTGHTLPGVLLLIVTIVIPLILIFIKEPLTRFLEKKNDLIPGSKGMFFLETFFEMFEVILSYITNTVSFVRVGAFALSHAGMMSVVLLLAHAEGAHPNIVVIILGNALVAGLEGLIVGIQVLRLEFYEMFSRFYSGTGKEFKARRGGE
ncbi:V-type ATP synthase subunit I [Lachnoclostridium phytofermentans]|uniref:V-type ATP synthase subunit I n=1 Tax=Lachnoclostridium phytofermentans TaxID=66219 RepID=UPI0004DF876D|nr:V-type ATPase 116kDa subunit family protein [Lachnoclostridium phytofermentans]